MNIQFRKIHLPSLPELNAHALIKLAGNDKNSGFKTPSLPAGVPKSKIISRSNLDEIIQDIETRQTENITTLEWIHCIYNKDKWDTKNPNKSISTSKAIWKAAEQNSWLKQKLFWNLVFSYEEVNSLASSLVESYSVFSPNNYIDEGRINIVRSLNEKYPIHELVEACWQELLTPYELFLKYQLPTKISLVRESLLIVLDRVLEADDLNLKQIQWLLRCFNEMSNDKQIEQVEYLLSVFSPQLAVDYPELSIWLRQKYGFSTSNSCWNELSTQAKTAMRKWLGAVSYQDFQRLVRLILDRVHLEKHEYRRLNNRSEFWSNYSDRFERIRILLPQSSVNILGNYLNNQDISILLEDGSDPTEICIFDFGNCFLVEFFRGNGSETRIFEKNAETEQQLFNSQLSIKRLRYLGLDKPYHDHEYIWQYFCEQWLRQKSILPNTGIENFKGLPHRYSKYNWQTGLPKPSSENQRKRKRKLIYWKEEIDKLEMDVIGYSQLK